MPATIQLSATMDWTSKFNFGRGFAIGPSNEPALTSANLVLQTILGAPFAWRWNRAVIGFMAQPGQQDYTLFNWAAGTPVTVGWQTIDDQGNAHVVTTPGSTGQTAPVWNHTKGQATLDGQATWTNLGPLLKPVSQTYRFGWIETASVGDTSSPVPVWKEIETQLCLSLDSTPGRPGFVAAQGDDGAGNITFRLTPVPTTAPPVVLTVQQSPRLIASLTDKWEPIPDEFSRIYNWGFLSLMWMFADDPRFAQANQKFVSQLLAASEGLTETERNIFLQNWHALTGQTITNQMGLQQGVQARAI